MKMINLKKIMSLVLVFALIIGGINLGARKVSAEEEISTEETENTEENLIKGQEGHVLKDYEVPAVQFSFDRETVNNLNNKNGEVNIILVVDASNSMVNNKINNQTRLALAKKEARDFVDAISATKNLTAKFFVYSFNQNVADKLPGGSSDATAVKNAINGITASQGTNISKGLYEALDDVTDKDSTIMVLLSDGEATYATTADGSTTYGPTFGYGATNETKNQVKAETKTALQAAVAGVADIYAISIFETDAAVKEVITKTLDVVNGDDLATQFGAIAEEIIKNATGATLIAEVGKYVAFSRAVDANGNEVSSVKPGFAEDGTTRIFTWDIPSPESLEVSGTEKDITSPIVEFTITATADQLIEAWKNGDEQVSAEIVKDEDGNTFANITLWLTAKTTLSYTQTIKDSIQNISKTEKVNLDVQSFIAKVAAITEVPVSDVLTVNYFVDNNEKPVASVSVEVPYGYELTEENKSDKVDELANVVDDPDFDAALYEYKETTIDAEDNVVNVYYVSKPLMVDYTVKYICEEEIDEANQKDGVVAQYSGSVKDNTPITIKSFAEVDVLEGVDKTQYTAIPEQNYEETVGVDNKYFEIYVVKAEVPQYTVEFLNNDRVSLISFDGPVGAIVPEPATPNYVGEIPANTKIIFAGWAVYDKEKKDYTEADKVDIVTAVPEGGITYIAIYKSTYTPPYTPSTPTPIPPVIIITTPTPVPTEVPTEAPTPIPTEVPTEEPTPTPEPVVEVEEPETPEGDVEIDEIETPEGAPEEEELDVEPIDTPQGDLPKTGVLPTYAFIGIGAACVLFGSILVIKRRKEEN